MLRLSLIELAHKLAHRDLGPATAKRAKPLEQTKKGAVSKRLRLSEREFEWVSTSGPHQILMLRPIPKTDLGPATEFEVRGDAQVAPLPVGFHPRDVILLRQTNRVAAEQQPEGWFI